MKRMIVLLTLALSSLWAMALPTVDEVQTEIRQGRYAQAETMMKEVVAARPNSARGHYVYAEILAHNGKREQAVQEVQLARQLDPAITFTEPAKFQAFEKSLQGSGDRRSPAAAVTSPTVGGKSAPAAASSSGIPAWLWGLGGLAVAMLVWRMISRRTQPQPAYGNPAYASQPGYGQPGYGQPMGGGAGSGMLGAGLAGVGGFAAGMLAEKYLHGSSNNGQSDTASQGNSHNNASAQDEGGLIPGYFDNDSNNRGGGGDIDFGNGDDWGGSSDSGGGGGDW